jgi:hypothetical protein
MEVVFSLMSDEELLILKDKVELMIKENVYQTEGFPLSCCGLREIVNTIIFSFWVRKGKGIRLVNGGEVEVCELKDSPFWHRYQKEKNVIIDDEEKVYDIDNPDNERDVKEEEGEFV